MMSLQLGETFSGFKIQRPLQWVLRTHSLPCRRSQGFVRRSWTYATLLPTKEKERSVTTLKTAVWQTIRPHKHLLIWVAKFLSHCLQNQQELACRLSEKQSALLKSRYWQTKHIIPTSSVEHDTWPKSLASDKTIKVGVWYISLAL